MNRRVSKSLTKYAQDKYSPYAEVWHNRSDGWWLETETEEIFLGSDCKGAGKKLKSICLLKD